MLDRLQQATREHPLTDKRLALPDNGVEISLLPAATRYILRCDPDRTDLVRGVFGVPIPSAPCSAGVGGTRAALWLGPDEWLLIAEEHAQALIAFASIAGEVLFSLVEVSDRNMALELKGAAAADILAAGCPLDLSLAEFEPGKCTRTVFGKCEIVLWRTGDQCFRLEFWRSYAEYVWQMLEAACADTAAFIGSR